MNKDDEIKDILSAVSKEDEVAARIRASDKAKEEEAVIYADEEPKTQLERKDISSKKLSFAEKMAALKASQSEVLDSTKADIKAIEEAEKRAKEEAKRKAAEEKARKELEIAKAYFVNQLKRDEQYYLEKKDEANTNLVLEKRAMVEEIENMSELRQFAAFNIQARIDELALVAGLRINYDQLELKQFKTASETQAYKKRYPQSLIDEPYPWEGGGIFNTMLATTGLGAAVGGPAGAAAGMFLGGILGAASGTRAVSLTHPVKFREKEFKANLALLAKLIHEKEPLKTKGR